MFLFFKFYAKLSYSSRLISRGQSFGSVPGNSFGCVWIENGKNIYSKMKDVTFELDKFHSQTKWIVSSRWAWPAKLCKIERFAPVYWYHHHKRHEKISIKSSRCLLLATNYQSKLLNKQFGCAPFGNKNVRNSLSFFFKVLLVFLTCTTIINEPDSRGLNRSSFNTVCCLL